MSSMSDWQFEQLERAQQPRQMKPTDPAYWMLFDGKTSTPVVYRDYCYICRDPEFAQMGLPLCNLCPTCKTGHVAADDEECDDCGASLREWYERRERKVSSRGTILQIIKNEKYQQELAKRTRQVRRTSARDAVAAHRQLQDGLHYSGPLAPVLARLRVQIEAERW